MLRNTLASNSANVALFVTPGEGIDLQWRTTTGGSTSQTVVSSLTAPYWIRLVDSSNSFTAFYSSNDTTWTQIGSAHSVTMNSDFFAGVALTSHDSGTSATATFNNVTSTFTAATIAPPALTKAAASSANPVTSTYTILSATATDSVEGASNLIFTWSLLGEPPDPVTFSANGTNSAASTTVSFATAGTYLFQVVISDPNGFQTISTVTVAVNQTLSSIAVTPASTSVGPNTADQLTAIALDQFGIPMANQPASFSWSIASGSGTVNSTTGVYTSPAASATATVRAASGSISGTTTLTTTNQPPLIANSTGASASASTVTVGTPVALSVPAVDDGGASNLTYTWTWTGPTVVTFTGNTNGTNVAQNISANFTQPGAYTLTVTVTDSGGLTATSSVPVVVIAPFATQSGSTLNIALNPNGPVSISGSSGTITATQGGVQSTFTGITTIVVTDSGSGDTLDFNGGITTPITFTAAQTSTINVNAGTLNFAGAATISLGALNIASGALAAVPVNSASQTQLLLDSLTINGGALDLTDNEMFITYGSGADPMPIIYTYLQSGYNNGNWNGPGIISTAAQTATNGLKYALGFADGKDGVVAGLSSGQIEIRYTLLGDANLDGTVNGSDFSILAGNFGLGYTNWDQGNFLFTPAVNGSDFSALSANFGQGMSLPATDVVEAPAAPAVVSTTTVGSTSDATTPTDKILKSKPKTKARMRF